MRDFPFPELQPSAATRNTLAALTLVTAALTWCVPSVFAGGCAAAPSGLVSWWSGEDTSADSFGSNDGALSNGATYAPGLVGRAFLFDGVDDQFTAPTVDLPVGASPRTLMFWVKSPNMAVGNRMLAGWGTPAAGQMSAITLGHNNLPTRQPFFWGYFVDVRSTTQLEDDTWHHLAFTRDDTGLVKLYVDGVMEDSEDLTINTPVGTTFYIGGFYSTMSAFEGLLDEIMVFDRALTESDIEAIWSAGSAGMCDPVSVDPFSWSRVKSGYR